MASGSQNMTTYKSSVLSPKLNNISLSNFTDSSDLIYSYYDGGNSIGDKPTDVNAFGIFSFKTASGWYGQLLMSSNTATGLYWRTATSLSGGWRKILDSGNYTDWCDPRYVNVSGDTMTGSLKFSKDSPLTFVYTAGTETPVLILNGAVNYGIRYKEGTPDTLKLSASGNANTDAGADLCINGNGDGTVTIRGNTILHAGNYTSYTVTKTGSGASGSWGISITGNAATATALTSNAGSVSVPVYFSEGKPVAINTDTANYTATFTVTGDANTYYPVVFSATTDKTKTHIISIWKNLSSPTAAYSGNHSNGTSSLWLMFEHRNTYWDGNGGYCRTLYYTCPYATLVAKAQSLGSGVGKLCVWLRGGGTEYKVSSDYNITATPYYASTNVGTSSSPVTIAPETTVTTNGWQINGTFYGNATTATRINGNLAAATSDVNRNIWVSSTAGADGIPNYISGFNMNPSTKVFTVPAGTRISPSTGDLYLGNSGNQKWVYIQDMCSQDEQKWKIHQNGNAEFSGTVTATKFSGPLTGNVTGNCSGSSGSCTGNAATATKFNSTRTIKLTGSVTGSATTDGGSGWEIATTTNHTHSKVVVAASNTAFTDTATVALNGISIRWYSTASSFTGQPSQYGFLVTMATGDSANELHQIFATQADGSLYHRGTNGSSHASRPAFKTILDSSNYTSYTVTKTGGGASGSWGISVTGSSASCTGNAATATKATQDGSGNTITSYYCTLSTAQTFTGNKTFNSICYFANGTTYYVNKNGDCRLRYLGCGNLDASTSYAIRIGGNAYISGHHYFGNGTTYYINSSGTGNLNALTVNATTASSSTGTGALIVKGGIGAAGNIYGSKVFGAVWNDYAEYREVETEEPGYCVTETKDRRMIKTNKRLQPGCKITSDTFGICMGQTKTARTPIAIAGRVLVYPYRNSIHYQLGDAVCSAPGGTVDLMTRDEIMMYPERIVGTVSEIPDYEVWHSDVNGKEEIQVNGRIWIYVK